MNSSAPRGPKKKGNKKQNPTVSSKPRLGKASIGPGILTEEEELALEIAERFRRNAGYYNDADDIIKQKKRKKKKKAKRPENELSELVETETIQIAENNEVAVEILEIQPTNDAQTVSPTQSQSATSRLSAESSTSSIFLSPTSSMGSILSPSASLQEENPPEKHKKHRDHRAKKSQHFHNFLYIYEGRGDGSDPSTPSVLSDWTSNPSDTFIADPEEAEHFWGSDNDEPQGEEENIEAASSETVFRGNGKQICESQKFYQSMLPFLWIAVGLFRLPFHISFDRRTRRLECRDGGHFYHGLFTLVNIILLGLLGFSGVAVHHIVSTVDQNDSYLLVEQLLFEKHWLSTSVFFCSLLVSSVGGLCLTAHRGRICAYINLFGETMSFLEYESSRAICEVSLVCLNSSILFCILFITLAGGNWMVVGEANDFNTMLFVRWFSEHALFRGGVATPKYFVAGLQLYALFSTWILITFLLIFSRGIRNFAYQWNIRIGLLLERFKPRPHQRVLIALRRSLKYEKMLKDHHKIATLVHKFNYSFSSILLSYIFIQTAMAVAVLFKIVSAAVLDLKSESLQAERIINGTSIMYYLTIGQETYNIFYSLFVHCVPFYEFLQFMVKAGVIVMNGFDTIRRYGLVFAKNAKERKFIMTLNMSFCAAKPHIINPYGFFHMDRPMIGSIFMACLMVVSIMVQENIVSFIRVPIILPCDEVGKICITEIILNAEDKSPIKEIEEWIDDIQDLQPEKPGGCPRATGSRFINEFEILDEVKLTEKCGAFCKGSRIFRFYPKQQNGENIEHYHWPIVHGGYDCMIGPYSAVDFEKPERVYDCFGNCYELRHTVDDCGFFPFGFSPPVIKMMITGASLINSAHDYTFKGECYQAGHVSRPLVLSHGEQLWPEFPMQLCQVPWTFLDIACKQGNTSKALYYERLFTIPTNAPEMKDCVQIDEFTEQMEKILRGDLENKNLVEEIRQDNIPFPSFYRFVPYTRTGIGLQRIPVGGIDDGNELEKLVRPYIYIHPSLMGTYPFGDERENGRRLTYGYFDCFGRPLPVHDDCGGLAFSYVQETEEADGNIKRELVQPKMIMEEYDHPDGGKIGYWCYEEYPLLNQVCGVPAPNRSDPATPEYRTKIKFLQKKCDAWKEYVDMQV